MKFMRDEEGVSPVIGVILMVAITVILAAVIAVFVFGLAGDLESSGKNDVNVKVGTTSSGYVEFTVFSGSDLDRISTMAADNGSGAPVTWTGVPAVGQKLTTTFPKGGESVILNATFNDGKTQIIAQS